MAQVLLASNVHLGTALSEANLHGRSQIWLDATTVYQFYPTLGLYYQKSVDAGATWGTAVEILPSTPVNVDIYYERWGSLSAPPIVHVVSHDDTGTRGLFYNHLNLATEVQGTPIQIVSFSADPSGGVLSVCVARNGDVHAYLYGAVAGNYHYISSDGGASFSSSGSTLAVGQADNLVLVPDFQSADTADLVAILYDYSATDLLRFQWDDSAGAWSSSTTIDASVAQNLTQNTCVAVNRTTGHIKVLAFTAGSSPETLKSYDVYGATVTARTNVLTSIANASICAIAINLIGHVYAFYSRAESVYYKVSTDDMVTWGVETAYSSVAASSSGETVTNILIEPTLSVELVMAAYLWSDEKLWVEAPAVPVDPDQYRLMLSDGADPDIPILNITPENIPSGTALIKVERGRESAVLGLPARAGHGSFRINNYALPYELDEPIPGLAVRLNKFLGGEVVHLWQGNTDAQPHSMTNWRPVVDVTALGPLTKLAGKKVSSGLYVNITTGAAIGILLDAVPFPSHLRDLDVGDVTLPYFWLNDEDANSALQKIINSEGITAELYEAGDGKLTFRSRSARYTETRSAAIQTTFRNSGAAPLFNSFEYVSGYREIVNYASHERYRRTNDTAPTVVWDDVPDFNYIVPPSGTLVVEAVASQPFFDAITPVAGVDFLYGFSLPTVTLERTSGQRTKITFTTDASGTTLTGLQLRATTTINNATYVETSAIDAAASVAAYGLRPWSGEMSKELGFTEMRDNLDAIVMWKKDPRGRIRFAINAAQSAAANTATFQRELGDRVRVIDTNHDFDAECWLERFEHEIFAPAGDVAGTVPGSEVTSWEASVIQVAVGSSGTGVGDNPYDSIDNSVFVLPTTGLDDMGLLMRGKAGMSLFAINDF